MFPSTRASWRIAVFIVLGAGAPFVHAADSGAIAGPVCEVLKQLVPETKGYRPEGARAQLVMAIFDKFDGDRAKLQRAIREMDSAASQACPIDRDAMLGVLKTKTLADAVR